MSLRHNGEVGGNGFGHVEHQLAIFDHTGPIRAAFNSGRVDNVAINDPFIDLNYIVFIFHYDSTHGKFHNTDKAENGKLVSMESSYPSSKSEILLTSNELMLVLSTL